MPKYKILISREKVETIEFILHSKIEEEAVDKAVELAHVGCGKLVDSEIDTNSIHVDEIEIVK